jgi:para-nitrobenzyl esterase
MRVGEMTGTELPDLAEAFVGVWNYERVMAEDCLVLNVWTPAADDAARPVLVWLHGGGTSVGSASWPLYDFSNLAARNDVVVVGVNHRLGILGFLDLSTFDREFADSGNVGMLDIVAALEWVRDNVASFGGDPASVTVFGESGGGVKVSTLLAMPEAAGLIHKAVVMSGASLLARAPDVAEATTAEVLASVGGGAERLLELDASALVHAELSLPPRGALPPRSRLAFRPTLGPSLPRHPVEAVRSGSTRDVDVLIGCTTHEMVAFLGKPELWTTSDQELLQHVQNLFGDVADDLVGAYRSTRPTESFVSLYLQLLSDAAMRIPHIRFAEAILAGSDRAPFMYLFAWGTKGPDGVVRSGHGADMPFFFDNVEVAPAFDGPHAEAVTRAASGSLVAFARCGSPAGDTERWPRYSTERRSTMLIDERPIVIDDPMSSEREAWETVSTSLLGIH